MNKHERAKETIVWNHHCFYHTINWLKTSAAIQLGYFKHEMTQIILFAWLKKTWNPTIHFCLTVFIHIVIDTFVWIKTPWFKLRCKIEIWSYKVMCLTLKRVKQSYTGCTIQTTRHITTKSIIFMRISNDVCH